MRCKKFTPLSIPNIFYDCLVDSVHHFAACGWQAHFFLFPHFPFLAYVLESKFGLWANAYVCALCSGT